jgi:hypothetical protein
VHGEHGVGEVNVVAVEADRLPDPKPGDPQQTNERRERARPQRRGEPTRGGQQRDDVVSVPKPRRTVCELVIC